ncbi:MAG: hypothetical protein RI556_05975 [Hydrogenovibrio sp.]|uniref:hypothetical protein n=1 Tax=Hydrogenovibrio sp. TaxID=2065821 RepID=UPI00287039FB|nr:hypothetical protein [Hydrogenovibrio sp.]MDR9498704.1 hypothetical protein [Hydrogenovibrio sp.]
MTTDNVHVNGAQVQAMEDALTAAIAKLQHATGFAKVTHQSEVLEMAAWVMQKPEGVPALYRLAPAMDAAGLFEGTDWAEPGRLQPGLVVSTLQTGAKETVVLDALSHLRLLAIVEGVHRHPGISAEQAEQFLTQVLALNVNQLFGAVDETMRVRLGDLGAAVNPLFQFLLSHIGFESILGRLIDEIWRILAQRPIQTAHIKMMVTQVSITLAQGAGDIGEVRLGADRLTSALFGPTQGCLDDPGIEAYLGRLASMDLPSLQQEASGFARAMHDVGLVSDYHAIFLRFALQNHRQLIADALGLSSTGMDAIRSYQALVYQLIDEAIYPETAQAVYGLSMLLERGILYASPIAPALWRQIGLELSELTSRLLKSVFGEAKPPRVHLLAGVVSLIGQPLGVGQGNNPTCQSARAISMWSYNDPDYLLHLIAQAARFDGLSMHFEGRLIASAELADHSGPMLSLDTDPVSVVLVPHLDRVYNEMGRLCIGRGEDPHRWINPEFHGWWVGREFWIAVDIATGQLCDYHQYLSAFYTYYHPYYNGNQPLIHPQPAGIAITDSSARFVGWHAITLIRVSLDQEEVMRVYFFNPNNDSGQDWGNGVMVSTQGHGERFGEASLPFAQLASRLYIFHADPSVVHSQLAPPDEEIQQIKALAVNSWAADRTSVEGG